MGKKPSKLGRDQIEEIKAATQFTEEEILKWHKVCCIITRFIG